MASTGTAANDDAENYPMSNVVYPGHNDVMCGRGGGTNNHIGNVRFRQLVQGHKLRYLAAPKIDKPRVAREVVQIWRSLDPPGRFLTKTKVDNGDSSPWHDVGDKKAREKASQCLRERTSDVLPFVKQLQVREAREKEKEEGAVRPESVKSSVNEEGDEASEEETKRFEAALAQSNDPLAQARLTQYLNDTAPPNSKIRSRRSSLASENSGYQAFTAAAASSAALRSAGAAGDYGGVSSPEEEVLRQHQILEQARRAQEAALAQSHSQNRGQLEDFEARQIVQQLNNDQVHINHQEAAAAAFAMQVAAQEQQRQIMEQAKAVQRQAEELDRQRIEMEQQRLQERAATAAIAAQLEQEKRKLQQQAAALVSGAANVTDDEDGAPRSNKRRSREELAATLPSAAELMDDFGDVDGGLMPAGMGVGDEELTMEEYQKSIEMFLSAAPGGMPPPPPKPPLNKKGDQGAVPSRGDLMETMSQNSWCKSFASIDSSSTMLFSISGQSLKNIIEGEELKSNANHLAGNPAPPPAEFQPDVTQSNSGAAAARPDLQQQPQTLSRSQRMEKANAGTKNVSSLSMMSELTDVTGAGTLTDKSQKSRGAMMNQANGMNSNISMMSELTDLSDHMSALGMKDS